MPMLGIVGGGVVERINLGVVIPLIILCGRVVVGQMLFGECGVPLCV